MAAPAPRLSELIDRDPARFTRQRVVAFVPHTRSFAPAPGRPAATVTVTEDDIRRIARDANARLAGTDRHDPLTIGHRRFEPAFPERQQPPRVGFARDYRAEWVDYDGGPKFALTYEECVERDRAARFDLANYPYRSAEYHPEKGVVGVACLLRPPALDMGTVLTYQSDPMDPNAIPAGGQDDYQTFAAALAAFPPDKVRDYMAQYMAELDAAAAPPPAGDPVPAAYQAAFDAKIKVYQADTSARIAALEAQTAAAVTRARTVECRAKLDGIAHLVKFGADHELGRMLTYQSDAERDAHVNYMLDNYEKLPAGAATIRVYQGEMPGTGGSAAGDPTKAPPSHEKAMQYLRANPGVTYDRAVAAVAK